MVLTRGEEAEGGTRARSVGIVPGIGGAPGGTSAFTISSGGTTGAMWNTVAPSRFMFPQRSREIFGHLRWRGTASFFPCGWFHYCSQRSLDGYSFPFGRRV